MAAGFLAASLQYLEKAAAWPTDTPFSMSAWVKSLSATPVQYALSIGDTGGTADRSELIVTNTTSHAGAHSKEAGNEDTAASAGAVTLNVWSHIGGAWAGHTSRYAWLDGTKSAQGVTNLNPQAVDTARIGAIGSGAVAGYSSAHFAEVGLWNVVLSDDEMAALAKGYSPLFIRRESLVAYYPLGRADVNGTTHIERWNKGASFAMVASGTPTVEDHPRVLYPG